MVFIKIKMAAGIICIILGVLLGMNLSYKLLYDSDLSQVLHIPCIGMSSMLIIICLFSILKYDNLPFDFAREYYYQDNKQKEIKITKKEYFELKHIYEKESRKSLKSDIDRR